MQVRTMPEFKTDRRYLAYLLDNSESMHKTYVGGESLFSLQVQQANTLLKALKVSRAKSNLWVLMVTFDGVLGEGWQPLMRWGNIDGRKLSVAKSSPIHDRIGGLVSHFDELRKIGGRHGSDPKCYMMVTTDGLDGYEAGSQTHPVSGLSIEELAARVRTFNQNGVANVLAIEAQGSKKVSAFFERAGFEPSRILSTDADQSALRKAFQTMTDSTLRELRRISTR